MIETWEQLLNGGENLKNESERNGQEEKVENESERNGQEENLRNESGRNGREEKVDRMMITRPKQLLTKSDILFTCSNIFTNYLCSKRYLVPGVQIGLKGKE